MHTQNKEEEKPTSNKCIIIELTVSGYKFHKEYECGHQLNFWS